MRVSVLLPLRICEALTEDGMVLGAGVSSVESEAGSKRYSGNSEKSEEIGCL